MLLIAVSLDEYMPVGFRSKAAGESQYIENWTGRGDWIGPTRFDLADDRNQLRRKFAYINRNLGMIQVMAIDQLVMYDSCSSAGGEASHFDVTDADDRHHTLIRDTGVLVHFRSVCHVDV
jgi:hypothetical protein